MISTQRTRSSSPHQDTPKIFLTRYEPGSFCTCWFGKTWLNILKLLSSDKQFNDSLFDLQPDSMNVDDEISVEDKAGPVIVESLSTQSGACDWPSSSSLTARLRRLITAYQRSYRQEQLKIEAEAKGDRRRRRCEQTSKLKEIARQERQQRYSGIRLLPVSGKLWLYLSIYFFTGLLSAFRT